MTEEAKFCVESCRDWYQAFANHGKGEERSVKELLTTADLIESLSAQLEQVTRERDAAVNDLRIDKCCQFCVNDETKNKLPFACTSCGSKKSNWRWRGVEVE